MPRQLTIPDTLVLHLDKLDGEPLEIPLGDFPLEIVERALLYGWEQVFPDRTSEITNKKYGDKAKAMTRDYMLKQLVPQFKAGIWAKAGGGKQLPAVVHEMRAICKGRGIKAATLAKCSTVGDFQTICDTRGWGLDKLKAAAEKIIAQRQVGQFDIQLDEGTKTVTRKGGAKKK